ncbi:MAG: hypothetical protein HDS17_03400 [Bacteroides sp.]|nr:hypothetical protein [Bacteroides sp.]
MNLMETKQDYQALISQGLLHEALAELDRLIATNGTDDNLLFTRGKVKWRLGDRAGATGDYAKATALNPESPAVKALENARDIANFFNPDLYNP